MKRVFFGMVFALICTVSVAMESKFVDGAFHLSGEIRPGDYDRLIAYFKSKPIDFVDVQLINLDSPGGSVSEAMKLAQFIRDTSRTTAVAENGQCMSACFFLFVAGGARLLDTGKLGIHRPYYNPAEFKNLSPSKAREVYEKLDDRVRQFLSAMRVPEDVVREMFATPSTSIKLMSYAEFNSRIGAKQPWFDELGKSACPREQEFRCMATKSRLDRLKMMSTYLGPTIANRESEWVYDTNKTLTARLNEFTSSKSNQPVTPSRNSSQTPRLDSEHPGWVELVRSPEYNDWIKSQPQNVKQLENSSNEDDAIRLIVLYKGRAARAPVFFLSCNLQWASGYAAPFSMDFSVDPNKSTVNGSRADIDTNEIRYEKIVDSGNTVTISISRRSGAISFGSTKVGVANGTCSRSQNTKF